MVDFELTVPVVQSCWFKVIVMYKSHIERAINKIFQASIFVSSSYANTFIPEYTKPALTKKLYTNNNGNKSTKKVLISRTLWSKRNSNVRNSMPDELNFEFSVQLNFIELVSNYFPLYKSWMNLQNYAFSDLPPNSTIRISVPFDKPIIKTSDNRSYNVENNFRENRRRLRWRDLVVLNRHVFNE